MKYKTKKNNRLNQLWATFPAMVILLVVLISALLTNQRFEKQTTADHVDDWGGDYQIAETFMLGVTGPSSALNITNISVNIYKQGTPPIVYFNITSVDLSTGFPNQSDVYGTGSIASARVPASQGWVNATIYMTRILNANTNYSFVMDTPDADVGNYIHTGDSAESSYLGGKGAYKSGSGAWNAIGYDLAFELWGISYPSIVLNSPKNNQVIHLGIFNCTTTTLSATKNVSLWLDDVYNITFTDGVNMNASVKFQQNLSLGIHNWTCSACDTNDACYISSEVRYFTKSQFTENSQTFSASTTEGNSEIFLINMTYDTSYYSNINAYFHYNNTIYSSPGMATSGNNFIFSKSITAPAVVTQQNKTFYWTFGLINSTGTFYFNSSMNNQSVNDIGSLDACDTYTTLIVNYTMKDERDQKYINTTIYNSSIEVNMQVYPIGSLTSVLNFSKLYNNTNNAMVCLQSAFTNTSEYRMDVQTKYYADAYVTRYNYFQNFTLTNLTIRQNINLFDLKSADATQFRITYKDDVFLAVADAIVSINKKYISEGVFKTVEMEKTDSLGQTLGYFDLSNNEYQLVITKNGVILSTFDNIAIFCEDRVTGNCQINLDAGSSSIPTYDFYKYTNLLFSENFNRTTRLYSLVFSTADNSLVSVGINLTKFDGYGNLTLCSNSVTTSSGTLTCLVPASYNNVTFTADLYVNGIQISNNIYSISPTSDEAFSGSLVIFAIGLVMSIGVMLLPSAIGLIMGTIIGLGFASALFFLTGSVISGGALILLIITGVIIIWRIRQGGSE